MENIDWLCDEWEQVDSAQRQRAKIFKQENLPDELNPDISLVEKIREVEAPAAREGSTQHRDSPESGWQKRPEDYFLPPE